MNTWPSLRFLPILAIAAAMAGPGAAAPLFKPADVAKSARAPASLPSPAAVTLDIEAVLAAGIGGTVDLSLPDGAQATLVVDAIESHDNGDVSWRGHVTDGGRADLVAVGTTGERGSYAEIATASGRWGVVPSGAGYDWLFDQAQAERQLPSPKRVDDAVVPPVSGPAPAMPKAACAAVSGMPSPVATIDVLAVMAPDFVSLHGGAAGAETRLNNIFASMNAYFQASNVAIQYRRVGTLTVPYQAANAAGDNDLDALNAITSGAGGFRNVAGIRRYLGADMVALFRGSKDGGGSSISGVAWINGDGAGNLQGGADAHMYSVNGDWNFAGATLPAHELGHNLGNAHDRPNANGGGGLTSYSYGHYVCGSGATGCGQAGATNMGTGFGTIMAYELPTVAKFSSPGLTCQASTPGALSAPCGVDNQQDDVRSMNCVRQTIAALRPSWVGSCNTTVDADGDGIPDCIETALGTSRTAKDNDVFTNNLLFAAQEYRDFLGREPDAAGLDFWAGALTDGAQTRTSMADTFFNQPEFQNSVAPVARLYFAFFRRIPDYGGLMFWIGQVARGTTLQQVAQAFAQSPEFAATYGPLDNTRFVQLVYTNVLGRAADSGGLSFWVNQLNSGTLDRGGVMASFSESPEYVGLIRNPVYVTMMYAAMLRRAPDQGGFDFWVSNLRAGQSGQGLAGGFLASAEYHNRFLP